jgi:hypothetical protein
MNSPNYPRPELYSTWQEWAAAFVLALEQNGPDVAERVVTADLPPASAEYNLGRTMLNATTGKLIFSDGTTWRVVTST